MSLFDRIFRRRQAVAGARVIEEPTGTFTAYDRDAYANDIYRGGVDAIARNAAKLKGSHVIRYSDHDRVEGDCRLNRLLQVRPNPYMTAYDMLYKLVTHYYLYNNSFALLCRDGRRNITGIYPITASHVDFLSDPAERLFCRFTFRSGKEAVFPYGDVIHLRRNFNSDELLGDDNAALAPALELAHTQNEGIINGIKAGAHIRGVLQFNQIMSPAKMKEERDSFMADYLQISNDGGVVVTDGKMDYKPIENSPVTLAAEQTEEIRRKIHNYLGVTECIVNSSYNEDQFAAFYESTVEPLAVQMSMEFTSKIFNDREQAFGNSILFESGRLQFTSNNTKVELIKELMPYGLLTINQALEILNLPAVADGDRRIQTLNVIQADKATEYQLNRIRKGESHEGN